MQQQHTGVTAMPGRAPVREEWVGPSWNTPHPEGMDWGKLREKEDLWLVMFPTSCLISDAPEKENSERANQNQNPVVQKPTWRWGKICCMLVSQVLPSGWYHACSFPASLLYPPASATGRIMPIELEISAIQRIYEKYFAFVPLKLHHSPLLSVLSVRRVWC